MPQCQPQILHRKLALLVCSRRLGSCVVAYTA